MASPIPRVPPVTSAVSPWKLIRYCLPVNSRERFEDVLGKEIELMQVGRHCVQEHLLDSGVDPLLYAALNVIDRPGQVDRLDVVPRPLVGDDGHHVALLLVDRRGIRSLLAEPAEIF